MSARKAATCATACVDGCVMCHGVDGAMGLTTGEGRGDEREGFEKSSLARGISPFPSTPRAPPSMVCVFPAPLCPYAMTVALTPRTQTSWSAGSRHARDTSSSVAPPSNTPSKTNACVCVGEEEGGGDPPAPAPPGETDGEYAGDATRISELSARDDTGEGAAARHEGGRTRHTTRVPMALTRSDLAPRHSCA
jgi:hypothetical protein